VTREEFLAGPLFSSLVREDRCAFFQRRTDGMRVARIPRAVARLGSDDGSSGDEGPAHAAELSDYLLDAEPVSTTAYARFLNAVDVPEATRLEWCDATDHRRDHFQLERTAPGGKWRPKERTGQHPMVLVSWFGANAYALWANRRDWRMYRGAAEVPEELRDASINLPPAAAELLGSLLPSEAQWEHAARGDDLGADAGNAWAEGHARGDSYTAETMPMMPVSAGCGTSPFGLSHMPGNVWQWCRDFYAPDFYRTANSRWPDPQGTLPTAVRSERGGSWVGPASLATATYRRARVPIARGRCLGFRCAGVAEDVG
jgi:formylglycine-generating enzyme required for sulfatase activity